MSTEDELVAEFRQVSQEYETKLKEFERATAHLLQRRRDIAQELVYNDGAVRPRTHKAVGDLLGLSNTRVGQLVKESTLYEQQKPVAF